MADRLTLCLLAFTIAGAASCREPTRADTGDGTQTPAAVASTSTNAERTARSTPVSAAVDKRRDDPKPASEPRPGSKERKAILDAVRRSVGTQSEFKVSHLRSAAGWAYFEGTEFTRDGFETDLFVNALLTQDAGAWQLAELWTLHMDDPGALDGFRKRVLGRQRERGFTEELLPSDFRKSWPSL